MDDEIWGEGSAVPLLQDVVRDGVFVVGTRPEFGWLVGLTWSHAQQE